MEEITSNNTAEKLIVKADDAGKTLVIRYDNPKIVHKKAGIKQQGSIKAPGEWIAKRKEEYAKELVMVTYDKTKGIITLMCNDRKPWCDTITGKLELNPMLKNLDINGKERPLGEMIKLLRFSRWLFLSDADQKDVTDKLMKFNADVTQKIKNENDQRGNIDAAFVQRVNSTANMSFTAECGIYVGLTPAKFKVDIVCEVRNAQVGFWFESTELQTLIDQQRDEVIAEELKNFDDYVCIEV